LAAQLARRLQRENIDMPLYRSNSASGQIGRTVTANATIAASDMGTTVIVNSTSDAVITIDTNANVPTPAASWFEIINIGSGLVIPVAANGVTLIARGVGSIPSGAGVSVLRLGADSWHVAGEMTLKSGIEYQRYVAKSVDQNTTHTFSDVTIGAAQGNRKIVLHIATIASVWNTECHISTVTINGISATIHASAYRPTETGAALAVASAVVPTGATASVVVTCTATAWCTIASYAVYTNGGFIEAFANHAAAASTSVSTSASIGDLIIGCGWSVRNAGSGDDTAGFSLSQVATGTLDLSFQQSFPLDMRLYSKSINGATAGTVTATSSSVSLLSCASIARWAAT
jgi:hypothetical protein